MTFKQFYANKRANRDNLSEGRTQIPMSELVMRITLSLRNITRI